MTIEPRSVWSARESNLLRARGLSLLLALSAACAPPAGGQTPAPDASPARVLTAHVRAYLDAFNTGRPEALAPVLERGYAAPFLAGFGDASAAAWERLELYRTYGPLALEFVDTLASPPIVWSRGTVSRGWVGHQLFLNDRGQATRHSIWRARPVPYPEPATSAAQVADSLRAYLNQLTDAGLFSGSAVVSRHGVRALEGSWGNDGQEAPAPVTRDTRFHIASVTKMLTVTALLQLVETGVVRLEDTIGRWIPEYPQPYRDSVRVRHLLTHTSGIELDDDPAYLADIRVARSAADLLSAQLRAISGRRPGFSVGSEYDYTSEGIDLLGVIIERATGRPWTEVVRQGVLVPAGMGHTRFAVPTPEGAWALGRTSLAPDLQTTLPGELRPALGVLTVVAKPSAGVWSTAEDLHRFTRALLEHRLLGEAWTDSLLTPRLETGELPRYGIRGWVGLGAQGEDLWGTRTVGHGGVVPGYSAAIEYLPANGWLLTVVSSTGEATGFLVFQRFLELVANDRSPRPPDTVGEPPGRYRAGPDRLVPAPAAAIPMSSGPAAFGIETLGGIGGAALAYGITLSRGRCGEDISCALRNAGAALLAGTVGAAGGAYAVGRLVGTEPSGWGAVVGALAGAAVVIGLDHAFEHANDTARIAVFAVAHGSLAAIGSRIGAALR